VFRFWIYKKNDNELYGHENSKGHEYFPPKDACDYRERPNNEGIGDPMHGASEALATGTNGQRKYFTKVDPYYRALRKTEEQVVAQQDYDHGGGGPAHIADGRERDETGAHACRASEQKRLASDLVDDTNSNRGYEKAKSSDEDCILAPV
jgi:uncharacterized OB-fold protein